MRNLLHFSEKELKRLHLSPGERKLYFSDTLERGLRIEVMPTGAIRYFSRMRIKGRQKTFSPGHWPAVPVRAARAWLQNLRADLNRNVPVQDTAQGKMTLSDFFKIHASKSWKSEFSLYDCHIRDEIGDARMADLERGDISSLHNKVYSAVSGRTANRAKILVHRIFNYAIDPEQLTTGNPAARIKNHKENTRDRLLMEHEMPAFFKTLFGDTVKPTFRDFILLSLFTDAIEASAVAKRKIINIKEVRKV